MKSDISFQLENAAWPAFVVEAGGTIRHANTAAVSFFGPKLEGEGISLSALWAEPKETADQFLARWERLPSTTSPIRFHGKGGSVSTFATYICPIRNVQKRYLFQLIPGKPAQPPRANDLSALGVPEAGSPSSSADTVFVHKQKLDCALQLTRSVALDFNNVLTCILGHTSLLLTKAEPDHPWRPALLEVEKATDRAAEITHDLAMFSRQEKDAPTHASGNLNAVLRRVVETFQKTQPIGIQWALHLEAHLYTVKFDEAKVQQVFVKILENAAEAVGETGRITVTSRNLDISEPTQDLTAQLVPGPHVCIEFSDDGRGIAPEYIARVFEPFFSTKHGHRGLGLAWVYGIVTNHRGGVAVSSQPREKTSVRVYLPASKKIVTETALMAPTTGPRRTILLVVPH